MSADPHAENHSAEEGQPSFAEAARLWAKIGLLSFGGPAGQIALMHRLIVEERRWVSEAQFLIALNFCMLLPGPEAQQLATYLGWRLHGVRGGLVAGTLFILPGLVVILALSTLYVSLRDAAWFADVFFGLKAAVLAIVVEAVIRLGRRALKNRAFVCLATAAFIGIFAFRVPFPAIVVAAGAIGFAGARWAPRYFSAPATTANAPYALDRGGFRGAIRRWWNAVLTLSVWGALWAAPVALAAFFAVGTVYPLLGTFFSKMAVITFGGAYAVLAYVAQQAVAGFQWVTPGEMLDGLAMAETTPGPLILVLVYVGFVAAYRHPGALLPLIGGFAGAALTVWVTFVPCFLWIFLGAPYVEEIGRSKAFSGALAAITAAVVGVILNLSVWFALHTLFRIVGTLHARPLAMPWPDWASLDPAALGLSAIAMLALFGLRLGMLWTLALSAGLGLAFKLLY